GSFISLWPACACGKTTVLEQFSLKDGRRLGALAKVPSGSVHVANPHADKDRGVWITMSSGPRCTSNLAGCGPAGNSCSGTVVRFDPVTQASTALLVSPSSLLVPDA